MADVLAFLDAALPEMEEARLLRDAVAALDDAFLVVVVGEFNSGKSSVINALLGERFLEEGILPTTNEISVLRHGEGEETTSKARRVWKAQFAGAESNLGDVRWRRSATPLPLAPHSSSTLRRLRTASSSARCQRSYCSG